MAHTHSHPEPPAPYTASKGIKTLYAVGMFVGLILFVLALQQDAARAWHSYLVSYFFFVSLAMGGMFFTAVMHAMKAGWSVTVRRMGEAMTAFLPVAVVFTIILLFGAKHLYEWMDPQLVAHDAILKGKSSYLNMTAFVIRLAIFFGLWNLYRSAMVGNSTDQDKDGDENHTVKNVALSVTFLLVFALSYSLFSVDTLMSLQPHWYSTMWGVYCFAGLFQSVIAAIIILTIALMKKGSLRGYVTIEHVHDLGKMLKAFTVFYAYIGFSQFLLIWYANLPEETIFYLARSSGGWMAASLALLVFKFAVPFLLLLPRAAKRTPGHLVLVSTLVLVMQYVDVHWMVYPSFSDTWIFSWQEIGSILFVGGAFLWSVTSFLSRNSVVAHRDPRLDEALAHHVTY